ncbi:MAG: PEGA domain-containing protein [Dictyoglomaceae bacterium]
MRMLNLFLMIFLLLFTLSFSQQISTQERLISPPWEKVIIIHNPETSLSLDLWLNKSEGSIYKVGEDLKIFARANDDCYLYIFDLTPDGEFKLVFPNMYSGNNFIKKNQTYVFPDKPTYSFKISPPAGKEFIVGIISKKALDLFPGKRLETLRPGESLEKNVEKAMKNIEKILIEGDKKTWAQKVTYFYVQEAVTQGKVILTSNPSNAQVYINNTYRGNTPLSLILPEGSYRILLKMEGYKDYETVIIVEPNREKTYNFTLSPKYGDLRIESMPSGAYIYIDGVLKGKTPITIKNLLAKTYEVKITYPGYQDKIERVEVQEDRETRIKISLLPTTGSLNINSIPQGAEVYLNGIYKGITPIYISELSPGRYQVQLRKNGYKDFVSFVDVMSGITSSYNFALLPLLGTINIFSIPSNAEVYVDGKYRGRTPLSITDVPSGTYNVRISLSGYEDYVESIYLAPGDVKQISVSLKLVSGEVSIESRPQGAKVYIDGKYQGLTPLILSLPEGKYTLSLSLLGYSDVNTEIKVKAKERYNYVFVLSPVEAPTNLYYLNFSGGGYEGNIIITKIDNAFFAKEDKIFTLVLNPNGILETKIPQSSFKNVYLKINFSISANDKGNINPIFEAYLNGKPITLPFNIESKEYVTVKWDITSCWFQDKENILIIRLSDKAEGNIKIREIKIEEK